MTDRLTSTWDERMAPCVHEAAHAVVAHVLGGRVAWVRVAPDGSGDAHIALSDPRSQVVGRLAGRPAELHYWDLVGGGPAECHPSLSDTDDRAEAWAAAQLACPGDLAAASELLANSAETATEMVEAHWSRIESVAQAVYESPDRRLLGSVFLSIMEA